MQGSQQQSSMSPGEDSAALKTLSSDFLGLLGEGRAFSDVTFEVEGRQVFAHRCVLAARSPFFRTIFCGDAPLLSPAAPVPRPGTPPVIPVGIVGFDVFLLLLQFLYSGSFLLSAHHSGRTCKDKSCRHAHCSSAVEFGLEMLNAAVFFGVEQLSTITQVNQSPNHTHDIPFIANPTNPTLRLQQCHQSHT
jgi:regulatory protein NPR1